MRKLFNPFAFLITMFSMARGMGTIDKSPLSFAHPYREEGTVHTVRGTRTAGPTPIPHNPHNQRQKRKRARQVA